MANTTISALQPVSEVTNDLSLPVEGGAQTQRVTTAQLYNFVKSYGFFDIYNADDSYSDEQYCIYAGDIYKSLVDSNQNNTPSSSPDKWILLRDSFTPAGTIQAYGGTSAPTGWLLCEGGTVSRTTYARLFTAISTRFGSGDGTTTFHLPDFRGRFLRGHANSSTNDPDRASRTAMNSGGSTGDNVGSVQGHAFEDHQHRLNIIDADGGNTGRVRSGGAGTTTFITSANTTGGNPGSETRPINAAVKFIIKI